MNSDESQTVFMRANPCANMHAGSDDFRSIHLTADFADIADGSGLSCLYPPHRRNPRSNMILVLIAAEPRPVIRGEIL
jgi:hypothetical protein